jgi:opacity protein-like surface antigen
VRGVCSGTSDGSPCANHVDSVSATLNTKALMASVFYAPLEQRGSNSIFQPFLVAGIGVAQNGVDGWSRVNADAARPVRSFEGASTDSFAWSVGIGASLQVTRPGKWPIIVEAAFRHYDFGSAEGGAVPLADNGQSRPREPVSFDVTGEVLSIGVRVPLRRY